MSGTWPQEAEDKGSASAFVQSASIFLSFHILLLHAKYPLPNVGDNHAEP